MTVDMEVRGRFNVLISSSRQWNPGDEFIMLGVRRLLETVLGPSINYILWNRNPDLFVDRWRDSYFRPGLLTNSAIEPTLDVVDLVVLAGTPEWFGRPVERIYRELLRFPDVPLMALGVGGTGPGFVFTPVEREVFLRENALIVCRNPVLADEVNEQVGPDNALLMPCPALFCSPARTPRSIESFERTSPSITVQGDCVENQSAPTGFVDRLIRVVEEIPAGSEARFVAHYIDEFLRFSRLNPDADIFYSYEPWDYIRFFRESIRSLMASRLHGAIAGLSAGTPACLVNFGSARLNDASKPFGDLLPNLEFDDALDWLHALTADRCAETSAAVLAFKQAMFERYLEILTPFVDRYVARERMIAGGSR
jgi:hypothetical protein